MLNIKLNEHSAEDSKDIQELKAMGVPYIVDQTGRTLFEKLEEQQFLIGQNNDIEEASNGSI